MRYERKRKDEPDYHFNTAGRSTPGNIVKIRCIETGRVWGVKKNWVSDMMGLHGASYRDTKDALRHDKEIGGYHYEQIGK